MTSRCVVAALLVTLTGCAQRLNPPRDHIGGGYRYESLDPHDATNTEETFVIVTISGGGTRAAAFGYGVLRAMHDQPIAGGRTMLDELDVLSSVSGGSFAAAYLGLFGQQRFLERFPDDVLYRNLEHGIVSRLLLPWNWLRLASPWFARSDLASEYYDATIFHGRTFATLPRRRPFIVLNATDIVEGAQFSFTQTHFDRLCSDLDGVTVARGVTASSAFPVAFTPLTLTNYPKSRCGYRTPPWVAEQSTDPETNPHAYGLAKTWLSYEEPKRAYIHLSDGGLSDNIGLRAPYNALTVANDWGLLGLVDRRIMKHLIIIVVDAKPKPDAAADGSARPPGIYSVLTAAGTNPMENYSADTVALAGALADEWTRAVKGFERRQTWCTELCRPERRRAACESRCRTTLNATEEFRPPQPSLHVVHVRFDAMPEGKDKELLEHVDTRLALPRDKVDALVLWGGRLLRSSKEYRAAVAELGGAVTESR